MVGKSDDNYDDPSDGDDSSTDSENDDDDGNQPYSEGFTYEDDSES